MKVGFTGTRKGMTRAQMDALYRWLCEQPVVGSFHHGDCLGADNDAANIVHEINTSEDPPSPRIVIVCHPPENDILQAFNAHNDVFRPSRPYLIRNRHIVAECDVLLACPAETQEELRSGTWYTVRHARRQKKPIVIIWPDGSLEEQPNESKAV